jgi:transposase
MASYTYDVRVAHGECYQMIFPNGKLCTMISDSEQKGFVLLPKRWLVERTFGWFNWCRR